MRSVIRLKGNKVCSNPKVTSPILHKTQGLRRFEWLRLIIGLYKKRKRNEQFVCDPKVHSIILARNPKVSNRCLNKRLIIGSYEYAIKTKSMNNLCGSKVYSIILAQNPRTFDGCLNKGLIIGSYEYKMNNT